MAYTTINKSSDYFNTKLYTGGSGNTAHTGVGFQPDLVWIKERTRVRNHAWFDAIRGARYWIGSNSSGAQDYNSGAYLVSLDSDGFTTTDTDVVGKNGLTYASWNWKAGTAISGATVGLGTLKTYTGSVNTTAGFSVIKYTGNGTAGHQFPHGLGVAPKMIMVKLLSGTSDWRVYHASAGATVEGLLNTTDAFASASTTWNNSAPNSNSMPLGTNTGTNGNNSTYIAYCFAEKQGYSKFGSYKGNVNTDGTFVYTGFKPAFVMVKRTNGAGDWVVMDNKRDPNNVVKQTIYASSSNAEVASVDRFDFVSNGFKNRASSAFNNGDGDSYIYMAFSEAPLVGSNNVPCTAR